MGQGNAGSLEEAAAMKRHSKNGKIDGVSPFKAGPDQPISLDGVVTVDSAKNDPLLSLVRQASNARNGTVHVFVDSSNTAALVNLQVGQSIPGTIVGHGFAGRINTGCGQDFNVTDDTKFIDTDNQNIWKGVKPGPRNLKLLTLCGCHTGADQKGVDLLHLIANTFGVTVRAPTGWVYAGVGGRDPHMHPDSRWQQVGPGEQPPAPIPAPRPQRPQQPKRPDALAPQMLRLVVQGKLKSFPFHQVTHIAFNPPSGGPLPHSPIRPDQWTPAMAHTAASYIQFDTPLSLHNASLLSIITGSVDLQVRGQKPRHFLIHNHRMLQDAEVPEIYYNLYLDDLLDDVKRGVTSL
jgi:hypothetical protein